uniref:S-layer homology domain-containing protein n=1 Tax=Dialister sp. TaxID=1955814 RepID=UPI0040274A37
DKLAGEYADELANLGVRVANLEKKVGNISWSGDARMQYQHNLGETTKHEDSWNGRMRINVQGQVNDEVTVNGRFVTNMYFKNAPEGEDNDDGDTTMDRINAKWTPNDATYVTIGRQGVALDQTGTFWDEDGVFDGVAAGWDNGKVGVEAGYGRFKSAENEAEGWSSQDKTEAWYGKLTGHIADAADVSAFYLKNAQKQDQGAQVGENASAWGAGLSYGIGDFTVDGDYVKTQNTKAGDAALWTAGLTYGEVDTDKVGSWSLGAHYVKADKGSMFLGNTALDMGDQLGFSNDTNVKFWVAKAGVAVQKNVELDAYYNFAAKADEGEDPDDTWGIELNYAF